MTPETEYADRFTSVAKFFLFLLEEKGRLSASIEANTLLCKPVWEAENLKMF